MVMVELFSGRPMRAVGLNAQLFGLHERALTLRVAAREQR
jgi:hypothetical protein